MEEFSTQPGQLQVTAMKLLADLFAFEGKSTEALQLLNDIVKLYPATSDAFYARLSMFYIYFYAGEYSKAEQVLAEMQSRSVEDEISINAARQLLTFETGGAILSKGVKSSQSDDSIELTLVQAPQEFELSSYPNPFNPATKIRYRISHDGHVSLKVYDLLGREVATLVNELKQAGSYEVTFQASETASGIFVYRLESAGQMKVGRMLYIK